MADDMNTFPLGPAKLDPDRDIQEAVTQAMTGSPGSSIRVTQFSAAKLYTADTTSAGTLNSNIDVVFEDGSFTGPAKNGTGQTIYSGTRVVVSESSEGYIIIGIIDVAGTKGGPSGRRPPVEEPAFIGATMTAVDRRNDLGLGENAILGRAAYQVPDIFNGNAQGIATFANTDNNFYGILNTTRAGVWYGIFDGRLYQADVAAGFVSSLSLRRFPDNNDSGGELTTLQTGHRGIPCILNDGLYFTDVGTSIDLYRVPEGSLTPQLLVTNLLLVPQFRNGGGMIRASSRDMGSSFQLTDSVWFWRRDSNDPVTGEPRITLARYNPADHSVSGSPGAFLKVEPSWDGVTLADNGSGLDGYRAGATAVAGRNAVFMVVDQGTIGKSLLVCDKDWNATVIDSFMHGHAVSSMFDDDPDNLRIYGIDLKDDNHVYVYGSYYDSAGLSFKPAIWKYWLDAASPTLSWSYDMGPGISSYVYGFNYRTFASRWMVLGDDPTSPRAYFTEEIL